MQCKIEGCQNRTWALNGLCLECEAKVWWMAHKSDGQAEKKQEARE